MCGSFESCGDDDDMKKDDKNDAMMTLMVKAVLVHFVMLNVFNDDRVKVYFPDQEKSGTVKENLYRSWMPNCNVPVLYDFSRQIWMIVWETS